jgi:hypothetical protein
VQFAGDIHQVITAFPKQQISMENHCAPKIGAWAQ